MDHNRTAVPLKTLALVMKSDREWFISLEPVSTLKLIILNVFKLETIRLIAIFWKIFYIDECVHDSGPPTYGRGNIFFIMSNES